MRQKKLLLCLVLPLALQTSLFATRQTPVKITRIGVRNATQASANATTKPSQRIHRFFEGHKPLIRSAQATTTPNTGSLAVPGLPVTGPGSTFLGWDALDSRDNYLSGSGYDEPPDQGLAASSTQIAEAVNLAFTVYNNSGHRLLSPVSLYDFYGVPETDSSGNFWELSDPRVYYDTAKGRWFMSILEYRVTPSGDLANTGSSVLLAVSTSGDATGSYNVYDIDVSDNLQPSCPCLGDQPLLGANQDGIFLNTNEFSDATGRFVTTLVIALDKQALAWGNATVGAAGYDGLTQGDGPGYSVQPAIYAPGTDTSANNGTEFFVSSLDFTGTVDNRLTVWSLTNTRTLRNSVPNLGFHQRTFTVEAYGQPPAATQKAGSHPLGTTVGEPEELIDTNDDRMQQVYWAYGHLYTALNTVVLSTDGSAPRAGIAWFVLKPWASSTSTSASVTNQGYIAVKKQHVMFPSIAVNKYGQGAIAFSLSGPSYFPSTAYVNVDNNGIGSSVHLAGNGQAPEDGFSGYRYFGGDGVARWGDYSAAAITPGGHVWFAAEYIPNPYSRPRTTYTNWGTFISRR